MSDFRIRELRLRNFRGFADARLKLDDVTFLVGRNGSGKSTLMDAFGFVREALTDSLPTALERRGNLRGVRRRTSTGKHSDVCLAIVFELDGSRGVFGFQLGRSPGDASYLVKREVFDLPSANYSRRLSQAEMYVGGDDQSTSTYNLEGREPAIHTILSSPSGGLALPIIKGAVSSWAVASDRLAAIAFHQFSPLAMRGESSIGSDERFERAGGNVGNVLKRATPKDRAWIAECLAVAVPGIRDVRATARAGRRVIVFDQEGEGGKTNEFDAAVMSDGTLRALGILLALKQTPRPSIVLVDEIEDSLHPFARAVLLEAIEAVSSEFPVVVSTHDPEVLSHESARPERIRIVEWSGGVSRIHHLNRETVDGLEPAITVGDLLRSNALWTEDEPSTTGGEDDFFKID